MSSKKIVTVRQMELLTDFMESHKDLALGRVRSKEGRALSQRLWAQISDILNAEDVGNSFRSPKDWNKCNSVEERLCAIIGPDKFESLPVQHNPVAEEIVEHVIDVIPEYPQMSVEDYIVEIINTPAEHHLYEFNKQKLPHTTERTLHECKHKTPHQVKRHKDAEVEKTRNALMNIENIKTETQKAMIEVEKEKVLAIKSLADAVWAIAHALKRRF